MLKVYGYINRISPRKLAIYLVLGPLLLFLILTATTVGLKLISENSGVNEIPSRIVLGSFSILFTFPIVLWLICLWGTVFSVQEKDIGLKQKWFKIAYAFLLFFIVFNVAASVVAYLMQENNGSEEYLYLVYAPREFINFGGIMIAYPIVCHFAARAATSKRNKKSATFIDSIPFTLFLVFGTVLGIPFLHKYFSVKTSSNSEIVIIYSVAFGLCAVIFIVAFMAAITGLI
jgi:hypothetical protein